MTLFCFKETHQPTQLSGEFIQLYRSGGALQTIEFLIFERR